VGINTPSPKATLHVAKKASPLVKSEGIIAPVVSIDDLNGATAFYGASQTGAIVYVDDISTGSTTAQTANVTTKGYYYFDGTKWINMAVGIVPALANDLTTATNGLHETGDDVQLGGALSQNTTISGSDTLSIAAPLAITSGAPGRGKLLTSDATGNAAWKSQWFYLPSFNLDVSSLGQKSVELYNDVYAGQFTQTGNNAYIASTGSGFATAPNEPLYTATQLAYIITYYDNTVIDNVSINANGKMDYEVIAIDTTPDSFINIICVVK
jgi:hypothetical protein